MEESLKPDSCPVIEGSDPADGPMAPGTALWTELPGEIDPYLMNGAALAYIGDAVYELMVRSYVMGLGSLHADKLHRASVRLVNARAQSDMIRALIHELSETETAIFKRGRNASTLTAAKHQSVTDYRRATGLEALFGYLYLNGEHERMRELFSHGMRILMEESETGQGKRSPGEAGTREA